MQIILFIIYEFTTDYCGDKYDSCEYSIIILRQKPNTLYKSYSEIYMIFTYPPPYIN